MDPKQNSKPEQLEALQKFKSQTEPNQNLRSEHTMGQFQIYRVKL